MPEIEPECTYCAKGDRACRT